MIKSLINRIKICQKGIAIAAEKSVVKRRWKIKNLEFRKSRDVTVVLSESIIKDVKAWELTDDSNKNVVKSFRGATTSQMKWHVKPTLEQNPKNIILHCGIS